MHFHLPKPLHGWREFAGEVGIIVVGVLIALGAEQVVENWHWSSQAAEARAALRAEIRDDDEPQAYARLAIAPCLEAQLKQLQGALESGMDRSRFSMLANAYLPPMRTWDDQAWNAVISTGVLSHGGPNDLLQWSLPYRIISTLGPRNLAEREDRVNLQSISRQPGALTPAERDRVTVALEHLRSDNRAMINGSKVLLVAGDQAGVPLTQAQQRQTDDELRPDWGKCMTRPNWRGVDVWTQSDRSFRD